MDNSNIKIVYKKPTEYDNLSLSSNYNNINNNNNNQNENFTKIIEKNEDVINQKEIDTDINKYINKETNKDINKEITEGKNYLEKMDNILTELDINQCLFIGILLITIVIIIMIFFKKF